MALTDLKKNPSGNMFISQSVRGSSSHRSLVKDKRWNLVHQSVKFIAAGMARRARAPIPVAPLMAKALPRDGRDRFGPRAKYAIEERATQPAHFLSHEAFGEQLPHVYEMIEFLLVVQRPGDSTDLVSI